MLVKNNYNECITNLTCSIQKYFGIKPKHNSLDYIDIILNDKKPSNVVLILFDGMGSRILDRTLNKEDFFIKNRIKEITTVFPATTTAATTSIVTGLNPVEHGWLGWDMYISPINKTISLYLKSEKEKEGIVDDDFLKIKDKLKYKSIIEQINKNNKYSALCLSHFEGKKYKDLDDMLNIIKNKCNEKGQKFIYAYDEEPDHLMHLLGPDDKKVKELIKIKNDKVEDLCSKLKDTIVFVIADHGHKIVRHIHLKNYPKIMNMLERTTSLEQRAVSFKIKEKYKEEFIVEFNNNFGKDFNLYSKEEVIENHLFGDGKEHEFFRDAIGDFIAIAEDSNKCLLTDGNHILKSTHGGYSDDEIYIPLIVIDKS